MRSSSPLDGSPARNSLGPDGEAESCEEERSGEKWGGEGARSFGRGFAASERLERRRKDCAGLTCQTPRLRCR